MSTVNPPITLPSLLALAMPSVKTRFNMYPPPPRLKVTDDAYVGDVVRRFKLAAEYHITTSKQLKKAHLKTLLKSYLQLIGGNVPELQRRCIDWLCGLVAKLFCPLVRGQVKNYTSEVESTERSAVFSVLESGTNTYTVLVDDVLPVVSKEEIPVRFMNAMMYLLAAQEYHKVNTYFSTHSSNTMRMIFLFPTMSWSQGINYADSLSRNTREPIFNNIALICKPVFKKDRWYLAVINLDKDKGGVVELFNPYPHDLDDDDAITKLAIR